MRKINFILIFIMLSSTVFGQDIIIDFAGSGASSEVSTVEVVNLSNCTSIEVPGGSSLNLTTGTVGVEEFENLESNSISSYPNPFKSSTNIEFYVNQNDYVTVTICDITGKIVANFSKEFTYGVHSFEFTANNLGMYFINVSGTNFVQTSKVICISNKSQQTQLVYNEQISETTIEKGFKNNSSKDFSFTQGDTLKLKGIFDDYATIVIVEPAVSKTYTFDFVECTDGDGNNYPTVTIGNQTWITENIKTTKYTNGDAIPFVENSQEWNNLEDNDIDKGYCYYDNDEANIPIYGMLYTYAAATNGDNNGINVQGVCPDGWHIPSNEEWSELFTYLNNNSGIKLKETCLDLWYSPIEATNETGFTAVPSGIRANNGSFSGKPYNTYLWSATQNSSTDAWRYSLSNDYSSWVNIIKSVGCSVRCVKN